MVPKPGTLRGAEEDSELDTWRGTFPRDLVQSCEKGMASQVQHQVGPGTIEASVTSPGVTVCGVVITSTH
ncbi:hypothetical protein STEG23_004237 [Scotinomys teguina]